MSVQGALVKSEQFLKAAESYVGGGNDRHMRYRMLLRCLLGCHRNAALCGHQAKEMEAWRSEDRFRLGVR